MNPTILILLASYGTYLSNSCTTILKKNKYCARWNILNHNARYCDCQLCSFVSYLLETVKRRYERKKNK